MADIYGPERDLIGVGRATFLASLAKAIQLVDKQDPGAGLQAELMRRMIQGAVEALRQQGAPDATWQMVYDACFDVAGLLGVMDAMDYWDRES